LNNQLANGYSTVRNKSGQFATFSEKVKVMNQLHRLRTAFAWLATSMLAVGLAGCPRAEKAQSRPTAENVKGDSPIVDDAKIGIVPAESADKPQEATAAKPAGEPPSRGEMSEKPANLGQPLVNNLDQLKRLDPDTPVWLDPLNKQVVFLAEVCRADYPLEFFATYRDRSYEAIVATEVKPSIVHAGLLALGAEPGRPVRFRPEFVAPSGMEVAIEVRWKDAQGNLQSSPAQEWVRNIETKKAMDTNWVFAGSGFVTDETTGQQRYMADGGEFICLLNLPTALLDVPIRSASPLESRLFEAFLERLPPTGTPVTILLRPKLAPKSSLGQSTIKIVDPKQVIQEVEEEKIEVKR
jgi:hypothetical protein